MRESTLPHSGRVLYHYMPRCLLNTSKLGLQCPETQYRYLKTIMQISIIIIYKFVHAKQRSRAWQPFHTLLNTAVWNSLINPPRHNDAICRREHWFRLCLSVQAT